MLFISSMLATRLDDPRGLTNQIYTAEPKLDGQCAKVHIQGHDAIHAFSRPGRELIRLPGLAWLQEARWSAPSAIRAASYFSQRARTCGIAAG
jgi:ATP-dependent DNA ligase